MKWTPRLLHWGISLLIGVSASLLTRFNWLAATLWCSAALYLIGFAFYMKGSGDLDSSNETQEAPAPWFAVRSLAIVLGLASLGYGVQSITSIYDRYERPANNSFKPSPLRGLGRSS